MLRDGLFFLVLVLATVVLYAITSFLFRSFAERRADLGQEYAKIGKAELLAGHPEQAINALRTALSYAPDERSNHLLLAEALAQAHHKEEATNYFVSLWESQPADGFINLELARLARERHDSTQAIEYYRAAASGSWEQNSIMMRRQVRLELVDYLIANGDTAAARGELLIAAGNSPETAHLDALFADKLLQTQDPADAMSYYDKALALKPHDTAVLYQAGSLAYQGGDYVTAHQLLDLALREKPEKVLSRIEVAQLSSLSQNAERILHLTLSRNLPAEERAEHLRTAYTIAQTRFNDCTTKLGPQTALPSSMQAIKSDWQTAAQIISNRSSLESASTQDDLTQLIFETEVQTARVCGTPTGDNALLLLLANSPHQASISESQ